MARPTPSERFVAELCHRAFLRLWTHPSPKGKKDKELCDCLVVCGPHIIIVSVKEIQYRSTGNRTGWDRWHKAAVEESAAQIWGAERWLSGADEVERADGRRIALPPKAERKIHRVSVSLGSRGQTPLQWGDLGSGFVHVYDEVSLLATFEYLDTITDFIGYLSAVEALAASGTTPTFFGAGPEDLLALYVHHGSMFGLHTPEGRPDTVIVTGGLWSKTRASSEFEAHLVEREPSYFWDGLVEHYANDLLTGGLFDMYSKEVTEDEHALVAMALQPRRYRRELAEAFRGVLDAKDTKEGRLAARAAIGAHETAFVFMTGKHSDRQRRFQELALRCLVVRGRAPAVKTVVGLATDKPGESKGHSTDILYLHLPEWTDEHEKVAKAAQNELNYFKDVRWIVPA